MSGYSAELLTDLDLPKRFYRVAINSLEIASIDREQGGEEVTVVARERDNRVRDSDIISTRIYAAREVVDTNVGQDDARRGRCRRDCRDRWAPCRGGLLVQESWKPCTLAVLFLLLLEKGLLQFVRGDLAALDEVLMVTAWIQTAQEFGFSPLPEAELYDDSEEGERIFV